MHIRKTVVAALLLASTVAMPAFAYTPGCPASQKTEAEGGAGGNWQPTPGSAVQRTEAMAGSTGPFNPATRPAASAPCN
ncbi:MAG TPA: hypothetical protein VHT74_22045 [Acetobacteraceae bacterium]|nr:hypothetical protein [Acetobacteraceae bacterium]